METTLNIHSQTLEIIAAAAKSQGISRSRMIILLLQKVMREHEKPIVIGRLVRYQNRRNQAEWRTFHIQFKEDEYEYFLDLRKLFKMSVSLILAYAVKRYLKNENMQFVADNNRDLYQNYIIIKEYIDDIPCWKLIWGYPASLSHAIARQTT